MQPSKHVPPANSQQLEQVWRPSSKIQPVLLKYRNGMAPPSSSRGRRKRSEYLRLYTERKRRRRSKKEKNSLVAARRPCKLQWAEIGKEQGRRREGLVQAGGEDQAQLVPELVGRERKARRRGRGFAPVLGVGRCWSEVVNRARSAASPGVALTPDWELGERVGGLLKQPDPGWTPRLHARIAVCPLITHSCW